MNKENQVDKRFCGFCGKVTEVKEDPKSGEDVCKSCLAPYEICRPNLQGVAACCSK